MHHINLADTTRSLVFVAILIAAQAGDSFGQADKRCDQLLNTTPGIGADTACLDLPKVMANVVDNPIVAPNNATRISKDGFRLCKNAFQSVTPAGADIVFIYDNSGSMLATWAAVDPAVPTDTLFFSAQTGCTSPAAAGFLTYQVFAPPGTATVQTMATTAGCRALAGDPYMARGFVIQSAIDFIANTASISTVGAIAFGNAPLHQQSPLQMNVPANIKQVKDSIIVANEGSTNYAPPLNIARGWLNNPAIIKTGKKAIVFISDGAPTDPNAIAGALDPNIPIYSIYLGKIATPDTARLLQMSTATGGRFFRVNPNNVAEINAVMQTIIQSILVVSLPKEIEITNKSIAPPQVSRSTGLVRNLPDSSVSVVMDSIIGLIKGLNELSIKITLNNGEPPRTYNVNVKADGAEPGSTSKQLICYDQPKLVMLNPVTNLEDAAYGPGRTNYLVKLSREGNDLSSIVVLGTSKDAGQSQPWGDSADIPVALLGAKAGVQTFQSPYPVQGNVTVNPSPIPGNGVLESDANGAITLDWVHPRDSREFATYTLPGKKVPLIPPFIVIERFKDVPKGSHVDVAVANPIVIRGVVGVERSGSDLVKVNLGGCLVNCGAAIERVSDPEKVPSFLLKTASPFRYTILIYDNLGNFVNSDTGSVSKTAWDALPKQGDSVAVIISYVPVAKKGQQVGTGVYIMRATITTTAGETKDSNGNQVKVAAATRMILDRFGYLRSP